MILVFLTDISADKVKVAAEIYQLIAIGTAALFGSFGALKLLLDYLNEQRLKEKIEDYKKQFPINKLGKDFDLVRITKKPGAIFINDKKTNEIRWIYNPKTFRDIDLAPYQDKIKILTKKQFDKLNKGKTIKTRM